MKVSEMSRAEFGAFVCKTLQDVGIDAVLTGGSCVSIYTEEVYVSDDLDFITTGLETNRQIEKALAVVGFNRDGKDFFHDDTRFTVEFPTGPLAIGNEEIPSSAAEELKAKTGTLKLLSPTDCVKDRLAGYFYWKDEQNWTQAKLVAIAHRIKWAELERWHEGEGEIESFVRFKNEVGAA